MNANNILRTLFRGEQPALDPGAGGTINCDRSPMFVELISAAAETRTLARPSRVGAVLTLHMRTDGGDITLTVTGGFNEDGDTSYTFSDPGQFLSLISCYDGTNYYWRKFADYQTANLTPTEAAFLSGVTAGTVAASKAAVVDANKDIGAFRNLRTTRIITQEGAPTSIATAGNVTYTAAQLLTGIIVRDPAGATRTDSLDTAAALVAAIPGATVGDVIDVYIVNGADAAENIVISAGAGGGFDANQIGPSRTIIQNTSKHLHIRLTNVGSGTEAYVIYC